MNCVYGMMTIYVMVKLWYLDARTKYIVQWIDAYNYDKIMARELSKVMATSEKKGDE